MLQKLLKWLKINPVLFELYFTHYTSIIIALLIYIIAGGLAGIIVLPIMRMYLSLYTMDILYHIGIGICVIDTVIFMRKAYKVNIPEVIKRGIK